MKYFIFFVGRYFYQSLIVSEILDFSVFCLDCTILLVNMICSQISTLYEFRYSFWGVLNILDIFFFWCPNNFSGFSQTQWIDKKGESPYDSCIAYHYSFQQPHKVPDTFNFGYFSFYMVIMKSRKLSGN